MIENSPVMNAFGQFLKQEISGMPILKQDSTPLDLLDGLP